MSQNNNSFQNEIMFCDAIGNTIPFDQNSDFFKSWNDYDLTVDSDRGPLTIKWKNLQPLAANWLMQTGGWMKSTSLSSFFQFFPMWCKWQWWQHSQRGLYNLPDNPKIIDIGAGNSVLDLLLHRYHPGSEFFLVDRKNFIKPQSSPQFPSDENPCWQHSWTVVEDAISSSNLDKSKFHFLDINDEWPQEVDMITSYLAWCMHFPKEIYWERVLKSLKIGGRLIVDINIEWEEEYLEEISNVLNCRYTIITSLPVKSILNKHLPATQINRDNLNIAGYRCSWTRFK